MKKIFHNLNPVEVSILWMKLLTPLSIMGGVGLYRLGTDTQTTEKGVFWILFLVLTSAGSMYPVLSLVGLLDFLVVQLPYRYNTRVGVKNVTRLIPRLSPLTDMCVRRAGHWSDRYTRLIILLPPSPDRPTPTWQRKAFDLSYIALMFFWVWAFIQTDKVGDKIFMATLAFNMFLWLPHTIRSLFSMGSYRSQFSTQNSQTKEKK